MLLDLAEAIGCTADSLERNITSAELTQWAVRGKPLWPRRLELMLAQLTLVLAKVHRNKHVELADFDLFAPQVDAPPMKAEEGAAAMGAIAGGVGVRLLGKKRREKQANGNRQPG